MSRRRLSEILGVSTQTVSRWEDPGARVWTASAVQLGQFYVDVLDPMDRIIALGNGFSGYLPSSEMASYLAQPTVTVNKMCEQGELECLDLGRLGMYVKSSRGSISHP